MNISGQVVPGGNTVLRQVAAQLSREARRRLHWMDFYEHHGRNARLTCRHFGISPDVFYRWRRRFDPRRLASLNDDPRTRRPHRVRPPQTPPAVVERIRALREEYPRWGKAKLVVLQRMPFPIRALQIDGGSEFKGAFEAACAARALPLFVVPPYSPKLQSHVERAQRTHREEFYQVWEVDPQLATHRAQLQAWAHI